MDKRWLTIVAAVIAVLMLYYFTGSWLIVLLFFAGLGALIAFQSRGIGRPKSHACLRCGAELNPNARECKACGSAAWTIRQ